MKHPVRRAIIASAALLALAFFASPASATTAPEATGAVNAAAVGEPQPGPKASGTALPPDDPAARANASFGPYHLQFAHSGKCLNNPGASTADNVWMEQWTCGDVVSEQWWFDYASDGTRFRIRSAVPGGKCLNFQGAVYTNGTRIIQSGCGTYAHGYFRQWAECSDSACEPPGAYWWIQGAHAPGYSGCMHQQGAVQTNGGKVTAWQCAYGYTNMWIRVLL